MLKNGEKILARVISVTASEIRFKKASNPDGPDYIEYPDRIIGVHFYQGIRPQESPEVNQPKPVISDSLLHAQERDRFAIKEKYHHLQLKYRQHLTGGIIACGFAVPLTTTGSTLIGLGASNFIRTNGVARPTDNGLFVTGLCFVFTAASLGTIGAILIKKSLTYKRKALQLKKESHITYAPAINAVPTIWGSTYAAFGIALSF